MNALSLYDLLEGALVFLEIHGAEKPAQDLCDLLGLLKKYNIKYYDDLEKCLKEVNDE